MTNKLLTYIIYLCFTIFLSAKPLVHKSKEKKGQKYYLQNCSSCHGAGNRGGNLYSQNEWDNLFDKKGRDLIKLHKGEDGTKDIILYLKSEKFYKQSKKMLKFLQEFANDSDAIPTCY